MVSHCPNCGVWLGEYGPPGCRVFSRFQNWTCAECGYQHKAEDGSWPITVMVLLIVAFGAIITALRFFFLE